VARSDAAALLPLAESIADGSQVDWEAAEAHASDDEKAIIRQLRVLSNLAVLHRSLPATAKDGSAAVTRRSQAAPAIGSWAHLALVERLGGGSFGEVYRAWDRQLEREVALKLMRDESVDDLQASRIAMEGRLLARIHHQNVITVHGVAVHEHRVGLWMELVRGATLEQSLQKRGPFSAREAALVGIDLCRALAAIHAAGLIHRDVKAQNVMREDGGRVVLMDLGTGREVDPAGRRPLSDLAGTPLYLAPEIFDGTPASERSDLYSLGVLLYHLVTGSFPARATTVEELRDVHAKGRSVRLRDARADLPTEFVRVVDRAIAREPNRRYASAGALEADLMGALGESAAAPASVAVAPPKRRNTWWIGAAAVAAAVLVAMLAVPRMKEWIRPAASAGPIKSIAVLPLENLSGDPTQEYFADGMTDELIATLGRLDGVNVISRTSVMQFKHTTKSLQQIAEALHVDGVVEGTVIVLPGGGSDAPANARRVKINARLIRAGTDFRLWDRTFEEVVTDVMKLQSEIAKAVSDGIGVRLTAQAQQPAREADFMAFDLYLKGRYYWNQRTEEGLKQSVQYFQEAINRGYAPANAGLSDAYHLLGVYGYMPQNEARTRASAAATKALQLDSSLAEAHVSLASIHEEQLEWAQAEDGFKRGLALKPGYATGHHWYAIYLVRRGRTDDAMGEINRALELDPLSVSVNGQLGAILISAGRYDEAIAQLEKTLQIGPAFAVGRRLLAEAYVHKGVYDRALAEAQNAATRGGGGAELRAYVGYVYAAAGRRRDALKIADELTARYRRHEDGAAGGLATIYAALGDRDKAFEWLEQARVLLDPAIPDLIADHRFDKLRADPRFGKLLATVGLSQ
jgi:TolB-like protein/Tfp pilus assembly protein PilF/tRNA A-37 threonylcarbamoyl transferase component Bud32